MDRDLLIDLADSPNSLAKNSENGSIGPLGALINTASCNGAMSNAACSNKLSANLLGEESAPEIHEVKSLSPFKCPVLKFKAQSVDSLTVTDPNGFCFPPLLKSPMISRRPQSVNLEQLSDGDSASLLSPFASPRPKNTPSLPAINLLNTEPTKIFSPFEWSPIQNKFTELRISGSEAIHVKDIPIGDLIGVQEPEPALPDDMFDINTLGKKQSECSKVLQSARLSPAVQLLLPSIPSSGESSGDMLNKGFMDSVADDSNSFPTPDDSVFEEAQNISKFLHKMATEASSLDTGSIEDEDGSIVFDCPEWREEDVEIDCSKLNRVCVENDEKILDIYSKRSTADEEGRVANSEKCQISSSAFSDIVVSPESGCKSFSSSISTISPSPLSSERVANVKLKARSLIGNHFKAGSLKLRASSCSSVPSSKPGPLKALVPMDQVMKNNISTPNPLSCAPKRSFEMSRLQLTSSPADGIIIAPRMSSTPKPHTPDSNNKIKPDSSLKKIVGNKSSKGEQVCNSGKKKCLGTSGAIPRSLSSGKLQESQKVGARNVASANRSTIPKKNSVGSAAAETLAFPLKAGKHNPSPLLQRKISNSPSRMKTPSRSISTGSLASASSMKKNTSPQTPSLQSLGRSNSISSKLPLCYTGGPLSETSVNSPAKHSSPLHKLVSKFRRNLCPKELKENIHPK
ncbi:adenomatous polyposis coli homolog isoform X2 [Hetaerina americana]|uniref:adenomatous polyposis coli homolog isoform X2 n=1 Tax=Hetaerina americana TaxID=62018 RepID=UPI003A7F33D5